jgi:hypothetical protein
MLPIYNPDQTGTVVVPGGSNGAFPYLPPTPGIAPAPGIAPEETVAPVTVSFTVTPSAAANVSEAGISGLALIILIGVLVGAYFATKS